MPIGRPLLELGVAAGFELEREQVVGFGHLQVGDHLRVTAIQALGQPDDGAEHADGVAALA